MIQGNPFAAEVEATLNRSIADREAALQRAIERGDAWRDRAYRDSWIYFVCGIGIGVTGMFIGLRYAGVL